MGGETFREQVAHGIHCCRKVEIHSSVMGLRTQSLMLILLSFLLCHNSCTSHVSTGHGGLTDSEGAPLASSGGLQDMLWGNSVTTEMVPFSKTEKLFLGQGTNQGHALHLCKVCTLASRREGRQSCELVAIPSKASEIILGMVFFGHGIRRKWSQILFKIYPVPFARFLFCNFHFPVWCIL